MWKRTVIVMASAWLLFAGYLWPHTRAHLINNWITGIALVVFGTAAYGKVWARYATAGVAVWLFAFSALTGRAGSPAFWNDAMVAVLVFSLSVLGPVRDRFSPPSPASRARG
jgi:hypothetical protein